MGITKSDIFTEEQNELAGIAKVLGHPARINDKLQEHTLDSLVSSHNDYKPLKQLRRDALKLRQKALKFKRVFGREEREERKAALAEVKNQVASLSLEIAEKVLNKQFEDQKKQETLVNELLKEVKL